MARSARNSVDYFPHSISHGKKMFYVRNKFGNDGYAVWFMLLEELAKADFHYLDLKDDVSIMYLSCAFNVSEEKLKEIINVLVKFGEFDVDLWESESILFNEKFIDNISDAYKKRNNNCIDKISLVTLLQSKGRYKPSKGVRKPNKSTLKGVGNTHSILKDIKGKDIKGNDTKEELKKEAAKEPIIYFHNDILLNEKYLEFLKFRKEIGKTLKDVSIKANIKKLNKFSNNDSDLAIQILDNSIANGYVGIFEINNNKKNNYGKPSINKFGATTIPEGYDPDVF